MNVLVVEDTEELRIFLVGLLQYAGYKVESAVNGIDALEKVEVFMPGLIISDILMPEMDGYELCKRIRNNVNTKNIPFIFYTATYTSLNDKKLAMAIGANRFIIKPEEPVKLLEIIKQVIAESQSAKSNAAPAVNIKEQEFDSKHSKVVSDKLDKKIREIEKYKEQLNVITDSIPAFIAEIDQFGYFQYVNHAYEELFHLTRDEIVGKKVEDIVGKDIYLSTKPYIDKALSGKKATHEGYMMDPNGQNVYLSSRYIPHKNTDGVSYSCFSLINNLTERKKSEEEKKKLLIKLHNSQKMESMGMLTGGVAHDYNNMLGVILGFTELLHEKLNEQPELISHLDMIKHAAERGVKLSDKLLSTSRCKSNNSEISDLNLILKDYRNMLEKTLTVRIKLVYELSDDLWPVRVDVSDLDDAVLNMVINAMHAMSGSGQLTILTKNITINSMNEEFYDVDVGDYVSLVISDTGCGMNDFIKDRLFEPFFTTKGDNGTGLGLSQVYGFIKRSNGAIKVSSEVNNGTQFMMYFPRANESDDKYKESNFNNVDNLNGTEKVLIVDDEPALTELISEILSRHGYQTICSYSAKQALDILSSDSVDLLISDIIMPEMDGYELISIIKEKYPEIKVQLVSGYDKELHANMVDNSLKENIIYKPYNSHTLLVKIRELLDA